LTRATAEATARAAARSGFRARELAGLSVTPLACAVQNVHAGDVLHARAIRAAIDHGINLLLVPAVEPEALGLLARLIDTDEREGLVVATVAELRGAAEAVDLAIDVIIDADMLVELEPTRLPTALRSIDAAIAAGRPVIATHCLHARMPDGRRVALVDPPADARIGEALALVRKLEAAWATDLGARIRTGSGDAADLFRWSRALERFVVERGTADGWQQLRHEVIAPHVGRASAALLAHLGGDERESFATWWQRYGTALHTAFVAIETAESDPPPQLRIAARIDPVLPEALRALPLACRALGIALSAPVCAAAVELRSPAEVAQLALLASVPHEPGTVDLAALAERVTSDAASL